MAVDEALTELAGEHRYRRFQVLEQERPEERWSNDFVGILVRDVREPADARLRRSSAEPRIAGT